MIVLGPRGMTLRGAATWLLLLTMAWWPTGSEAAGPSTSGLSGWHLPVLAVAAQTPLEAQMAGERPPASQSLATPSLLQSLYPVMDADRGGATFRLPQNFRVSFRYHGEPSVGGSDRSLQQPLLFKYSMDYFLLPNLQVGMSGFLYQPPADYLSFLRRGSSDLVLGWGPGIRYDLGRWSFTFRSQVQTGGAEKGQDLQNWFRVWYAF